MDSCTHVKVYLGIYQEAELLRHRVCTYSSFPGIFYLFFKVTVPIYTPINPVWEVPFHRILTVIVMYNFSHFCQTHGYEKVSHCFNLHFWITAEVDQLVVLMVITVFHYECVFISFVHFSLLGCLAFSYWSFIYSWY